MRLPASFLLSRFNETPRAGSALSVPARVNADDPIQPTAFTMCARQPKPARCTQRVKVGETVSSLFSGIAAMVMGGA